MKRSLSIVLVIVGFAALMGCQSETPTGAGGTGQEVLPGLPVVPDCPGGKIVNGMVGPTCTMPTPDAGKSCKKASDCSGHCMAETMTCSKENPNFGCHEVVTDGGQIATLCVD